MRNLKKILALVLALVMSLSLMATAGAANFTDASSINDKYETAVEVLEGLGVFRGYQDGSFQPTGSITRAETAAIIYRIVTGDVKDEQVGIYADYNLFTDVPSTAWYAGYVNYCANAEYIKGVGGGKFNPNAQVTGYAALAMILRAIGYTANGGFTGPDWEVQTARTGEARKITKNIMTGTLGQPATRETVAEILFQAILVNMVDHNVLHTQNGQQGYTEIDMTLGYKTFGLEQIEGVVMANEYANLYTNKVLANDKTQLKVAGEENARTLNKGTLITDIGESRYAYVTGSKVLAFGDTGKNKVTETGAAVNLSVSGFSAVAEMPADADIEYYTNFDLNVIGDQYCEQRLEFSVVVYDREALNTFNGYTGQDMVDVADDDGDWVVEYTSDGTTWVKLTAPYGTLTWTATSAYRFTKIIYAYEYVSDIDLDILKGIFGTADNKQNNLLNKNKITGDVYVGTKSTPTETDEERDLSNSISYKKFVDEYIKTITEDGIWTGTYNGWWVKFIDNDGDGDCDYAFRTWYYLDKALYTFTDRDGNNYMEYRMFDDENHKVRYLNGYTPSVGDKVLAAPIDGQWLVEPAQSETVVVSSYSWRNDEITTDKGPYGQSGIINATDMLDLISTMEDKITYVVYLDHFGYVRAYELPGGKQYALITEMYYTNGQQGNLVDEWPMTAELTTLEDGETLTKEYNIVGGAKTFTAKQPWMRVENAVATYNFNNWLQPVIAHLGVTRTGYAPTTGTPVFVSPDVNSGDDRNVNAYTTFWDANRQLVRRIATNGMASCQEFNYGPQTWTLKAGWTVAETASFTNVAVVNINGNDASLAGAATLNLNTNAKPAHLAGVPAAYATDYIQLDTVNIAAKAVRYPIGGDPAYVAANNTYVNAVHDTQYFIAYNGGVVSFTDYEKFPGLNNTDNKIHAAYAVARNTVSDVDGQSYWVADVIVYEVYDLDDTAQTSVSLAFYTPTRTSGNVQEIETLNSKYLEVTLLPGQRYWSADKGQWGAEWEGYGFYALFNDTEPVDNVMTARNIEKLELLDSNGNHTGDYAKNNIHAGTIIREAYIEGAGQYIDVDMNDDGISDVSIEITNKIYSITTDQDRSNRDYTYNYATLLRYQDQANSNVRKGDKVIWVGAAKTDRTKSATNFVIDLGSESTWTNNRALSGYDLLLETWATGFLIDCTKNVTTGRYEIDDYDTATNNSGVWQQIMCEQNTPDPDFTIKVVSVLDENEDEIDGITVDDVTVTPNHFNADQGKASFDITFTVPTGYVVKAASVANVGKNAAGEHAVVRVTDDPNVYRLSNATGDVELNVVLEEVTYTLAVTFADGVAAQALTLTVDGTGTTMTEPVTLPAGTAYEVSFTPAANTTYLVDGDDATIDAGKVVIEGTLDADTEHVITTVTKTLTVVNSTGDATLTTTLKNAANEAVATWNGTTITIGKGTYTLTLTVPANTTYVVNSVEYKNNTAAAVTRDIAVDLSDNVTLTVSKLTKTLAATLTDADDVLAGAKMTLKVNAGAAANWNGAVQTLNKGAEYVILITPTDGYKYTVDSEPVTAEETGENAGKIVIAGDLDDNTTYAIAAVELSDVVEPTSVKVNGEDATLSSGAYTATGDADDGYLLHGTETATVVITPAAGSEITSVWEGQATFGTQVTATAANTYTMKVNASTVATASRVYYTVVIKAEDGTTTGTYTVTIVAAAASSDTGLEAAAGSGIVIDDTASAEKVKLPAGTVTTVGTLKGLLSCTGVGAELEIVKSNGDATTDTDTVVAGMKVVVTAQDGTEVEYTIAIG